MKFLRIVPLFYFLFYWGIANGQNSSASNHVRIYLGWTHQFQFAGYYMAKELGYYSEAGLNVDLIPFDGSLGSTSILSDKYEYGVASAGQLIGSQDHNKLVVVAPVFQQSPLSLLVRRDSEINILKDLEGKKVGSGNEIKAMLNIAGVELDSIEFAQVTSIKAHLLSGEYDAITHYINDPLPSPEEFKIFRPIEYGVNFYGECLFTSKKELDANPERVLAMYQATLKGWEYAVNNPEETIDMILKNYYSGKSREDLNTEAAIVINSQILPSFYPIGFSDKEKWSHMEKTLASLSAFEEPLNLEDFVFNPDPEGSTIPIKRLLFWTGGTLLVLTLTGLGLFFYNRQLRKAVMLRTVEVQAQNDLLVTQTKKLEALNSFQDKILSVISHDVRGPIGSVKGILKLNSSGNMTDEEFEKFSKAAIAKMDEVDGLMENLISWFKDQASGGSFKMENLDICGLTKNTIPLLDTNASEKGVTIEYDLEEPIYIHGNVESIKLIIRNLLSNAIKFSNRDDTITIEIEDQHDWIKYSVSDTGRGMDAGTLEKLFKSTLSSTPGTKGEAGTGLGLLLCKEFIMKNGGEIGANSKLGEGSSFWIKLKKVNA